MPGVPTIDSITARDESLIVSFTPPTETGQIDSYTVTCLDQGVARASDSNIGGQALCRIESSNGPVEVVAGSNMPRPAHFTVREPL